jgi:ubiquinone/menaquinone biosynthesis C-methylase UbiE
VTLVCPRCRGLLSEELACAECGARYERIDSVPVLVPDSLSEQHLHQLAYFDAEFSEYGEYTVENWRQSYIDRIFAAVGVLAGAGPYLDVGVGGSGATIIEAARRGVDAVGCDLSPEGVLAARRFAHDQGVEERVELVVCAAEALPFPDASFGSASAVAVLEHLDDDRPAVAELARVLRPGAKVWLMVPHLFRYMPPPVSPVYWWHDRRIGHKRHYDEERLVRLCAEFNLEHVRTQYSAHPVKLLQVALTKVVPSMREPGSRAWWRLEQLDRKAECRRWGAVHLNAVFRRAA